MAVQITNVITTHSAQHTANQMNKYIMLFECQSSKTESYYHLLNCGWFVKVHTLWLETLIPWFIRFECSQEFIEKGSLASAATRAYRGIWDADAVTVINAKQC